MNSTTRAYFFEVTDNCGRPLSVPNANNDNLDKILGNSRLYKSVFAVDCSRSGADSAWLADRCVYPALGWDIEVMRLNERYSDTFEFGFQAFTRISGFGTDAGTHPLIKLTMHA